MKHERDNDTHTMINDQITRQQ